MSEQPKKKLSLNVLPDQDRLAQIMQRAESAAKPSPAGASDDEDDDAGPGQLLPPADWPIERKLTHGKIVAALKKIYDPEIPVDIYELGLIYNIDISPENIVKIRMTLTAPGCPVAGELVAQVESAAEAVDEVKEATVDLVWDPPWSRDRMSEAARMHLGF